MRSQLGMGLPGARAFATRSMLSVFTAFAYDIGHGGTLGDPQLILRRGFEQRVDVLGGD